VELLLCTSILTTAIIGTTVILLIKALNYLYDKLLATSPMVSPVP
jgi:hypothetical protein